MFSLVKFDNEEYEVISSKRVKVVQDTDCIVKYTNGAKYHASLLDTAGTKEQLVELLEKIQRDEGINQEETTPENTERDVGNPQALTSSKNIEQDDDINRRLTSPKNIERDDGNPRELTSSEKIQQDNDNSQKSTSPLPFIIDVDLINSTFVVDQQPISNNTSTPKNAMQSKSNGFFKELALLDILDISSLHGSMSSDAPTGITEIKTVIGESWLGVSGASSQDEKKLVTTSKHVEEQITRESSNSKGDEYAQ